MTARYAALGALTLLLGCAPGTIGELDLDAGADAPLGPEDVPERVDVVATQRDTSIADLPAERDVPAVMDVARRDVLVVSDGGRRDVPAVMDAVVRDVPAVSDSGRRDVPAAVDVRPQPTDTGEVPIPLPSSVRPGESCHTLIRSLGMRFTVGPATRGIEDPVSVTTPIEGVHYRYASWTASDRALVMDCRLAVALARMSRALRDRWNITDVQHIGIYNYRTISGSTRLSQHAYATAIDIGALRARNGTTYSVLTDFTMNGAPTCPPRATNAIDRVLKEFACWMYDSRTFHIILTPNYNSAHRNHFHVDLTTGSHFISIERPSGVDPEHDPFFDLLIDDD